MKNWYSFLLSTEIHQWFWLLIESKLTQWNINKHIFITTKMMNKKFMFWLCEWKLMRKSSNDERKWKWSHQSKSSNYDFKRWWNEWFDELKMKMNWENAIKINWIDYCLFWFIFDCFIHFSFYFFQNQKYKQDEQKNETQQRIIDSLLF